MLFR
jgi:hypothetical protein